MVNFLQIRSCVVDTLKIGNAKTTNGHLVALGGPTEREGVGMSKNYQANFGKRRTAKRKKSE